MIVNQRSLSIKDSLCLTFDYAAQYIVWQGEIVLYFPPPAFLFRLTRQTYLKFDLPVIRPMAPLLLRPASPAAWAPKLWPMTWTLEGEYPSDDCGKIKATSLITLKGVSWTYLLDPKPWIHMRQCTWWVQHGRKTAAPCQALWPRVFACKHTDRPIPSTRFHYIFLEHPWNILLLPVPPAPCLNTAI